MKTSHPPIVSPNLASAADQARARVASAEKAVQTAKSKSREAKRKRKLGKEAARRAKKQLKRAKEVLAEAEFALADVEKKQARERKRQDRVTKPIATRAHAKTNAARRTTSSRSRVRRTVVQRSLPAPKPQTPAEPALDPTNIEKTAKQPEPPPAELGGS
jgi:chromosome segregation ATPase